MAYCYTFNFEIIFTYITQNNLLTCMFYDTCLIFFTMMLISNKNLKSKPTKPTSMYVQEDVCVIYSELPNYIVIYSAWIKVIHYLKT